MAKGGAVETEKIGTKDRALAMATSKGVGLFTSNSIYLLTASPLSHRHCKSAMKQIYMEAKVKGFSRNVSQLQD